MLTEYKIINTNTLMKLTPGAVFSLHLGIKCIFYSRKVGLNSSYVY